MGVDFKYLRKKQQEKAKNGSLYKTNEGSSYKEDERMYKIGKDTNGNGTATIRLLSSLNKDKTGLHDFVIRDMHSINTTRPGTEGKDKNDKRWRSFLCIGDGCPACKQGWDLYNEAKKNGGTEKELGNILSSWMPKNEIFTNIIVKNDPINPDNEGKVFLFKMPKTILDMLGVENQSVEDAFKQAEIYKDSDPEKYSDILTDALIVDGVSCFNGWDLGINGKNIILNYTSKKSPNWTKPVDFWGFSKISPRFKKEVETDEEYEKLVNSAYCLDEFLYPEEFENAHTKPLPPEKMKAIIEYLKFEVDKISFKKKDESDDKKTKEVKKESKEDVESNSKPAIEENNNTTDSPAPAPEKVENNDNVGSNEDKALEALFGDD